MMYAKEFVSQLQHELPQLANRTKAIGAENYMKNISPFLGVQTPDRRRIVTLLAKSMTSPNSGELGETARALWKLDFREYQYAACDLIDYHSDVASADFLQDHVEFLITHKSWWDTVDALGNAAVSPLTDKYGCEELIERWNRSSNVWLIRSAIQHQRGRKLETDVKLVLRYCDQHSDSKEFFIVKAIGWALRDISKIAPNDVRKFLLSHPQLGSVAVREAKRGLAR